MVLTRLAIGTVALGLPYVIEVSSRTFFGVSVGTDFATLLRMPSGVDFGNLSLCDFDRMAIRDSNGRIIGHVTYESSGRCNVMQYGKDMLLVLSYGLIPFGLIAMYTGIRTMYLSSEGNSGGSVQFGGGVVKFIAGVLLINMLTVSCAITRTVFPSIVASSLGFYQGVCTGESTASDYGATLGDSGILRY
jgi:hypothetical protein